MALRSQPLYPAPCLRAEAPAKASALGVFALAPQNLAVAERFLHGTSPVDWHGFALDRETVPWHRRPEVSQEHASLEAQRAVDVQPVE